MALVSVGTVRIRPGCMPLLKDNLSRISVLYAAQLVEGATVVAAAEAPSSQLIKKQLDLAPEVTSPVAGTFTELEVFTSSYATDLLIRVQRYVDEICREGCTAAAHAPKTPTSRTLSGNMLSSPATTTAATTTANILAVQSGNTAGEDSSYDSDGYDNESVTSPIGCPIISSVFGVGSNVLGLSGSASDLYLPAHVQQQHDDVSRTTSDTLAAEYADYVQTGPLPTRPSTDLLLKAAVVRTDSSSNAPSEVTYDVISTTTAGNNSNAVVNSAGYTARVEFALKLGYTERLVQAVLAKLGPAPTQNELLAELIKLGSQRGVTPPPMVGTAPGTTMGLSVDSAASDVGEGGLDGASVTGLKSSGGTAGSAVGAASATVASAQLRPIVIDGSNLAMSHGNKEVFSCRGIKICVDYFRTRGHREITVFVPKWRKEAPRPDNPVQDQEILAELERERLLAFTPSRLVGGKRTVCYDDRYILKLAAEIDGIVVSNDNYRDLCQENSEYRRVVDERVLMYTFVNDRFMPPDDPLGRSGPTLDNFLKIGGRNTSSESVTTPPPCPYAKKCTYGNKCKYHHPERGPLPHKSVTERLSEHAQRHLQARDAAAAAAAAAVGSTGATSAGGGLCGGGKQPLGRTRSVATPPAAGGGVHEQMSSIGAAHAAVSKSRSVDACANLHKKLQRQLTLNPAGNDPRLQSHYYSPYWDSSVKSTTSIANPSQQSSSPQPQQVSQSQLSLHQQQQQYHHHVQSQHAHVTRIASAPDSQLHHHRGSAPLQSQSNTQLHFSTGQFHQNHHHLQHQQQHANNRHQHQPLYGTLSSSAAMTSPLSPAATSTSSSLYPSAIWPPAAASCSEPQLWQHQQQQQQQQHMDGFGARDDARRKLHYHLAAIFPEDQVAHAMCLYPDETNPQKICAAILTLFK